MRKKDRKKVCLRRFFPLFIPFLATFLSSWELGYGEDKVFERVYRNGLIIAEVVRGTDHSVSSLENSSPGTSPFPLQAGWPVTVNGRIDSNPALGDLDGDGDLEVVFQAFDQMVHAHHHDGTVVAGWPQPGGFGSSPSLVDLERDGTLEIFIGGIREMLGFFHDGTRLPGWPQESTGGFSAPASINDLDRDGDMEIAAGTSAGPMHVWDESGENHSGWPKDLPGPVLSVIIAASSSGNLDADPELEIVVGSQRGELFAWDHNGDDLSGFPKFMNSRLHGEAALADLNEDGELEIAFGTDLNENDRMGRVFVLTAEGTILPGWPQEVISIVNGGIAVGDLNLDGTLEVVAATNNVGGQVHGKVWVWNGADGSLLPGWPQIATITNFNASPALGDLNGDGLPDILAVGLRNDLESTGVWAWNADGTLIEGFPFQIFGAINSASDPTITDLDGDGDVEIGFGTEDPFSGFRPAKMYFFDLPAPYDPLTMEWPTLSHDFQRTGRYSPPGKIPVSFEASIRQPHLSLQHPPALLIMEASFEEDASDPFAITDLDGLKIEPIVEEAPEIESPGRPGWRILRFDAREVAEAILDVNPGASEVRLTLRAPIDEQRELVGVVLLSLR